MRQIFIEAIEAFGVPYEISYDQANLILAFVPFSRNTPYPFMPGDIDDLHYYIADQVGIPVYDVILEETRDGVQIGIDY